MLNWVITYNSILPILDDVLSKKEDEDEGIWRIFFQNKTTNSSNVFIHMQWQISVEITLPSLVMEI